LANIRTLKLNLLADTTDFSRGIKNATGQTESFSSKIAKSLKVASFAAAGLATAFAVDAVKAAAADQKSQKQLQLALKNTTKATNAQVSSVEKWITKQQLAYGVSDSKLRPSLAKLVRVTGDVKKSQDLLNLALDISAGTGKDLESVTNALTRAQQGNLSGLKKLGIPLSDTIIKNKDLSAGLKIAEDRFKGAAKAGAETFDGKMRKLNESIGEAKESIGGAIITAIQPFADKWMPLAATGVQHFIDGLLGQNNAGGLKGAMKDSQIEIFNTGQKIAGFFKTLKDNKDLLMDIGKLIAAIFIGAKAYAAVAAMAGALSKLRLAFAATTAVAATTAGAEAAATGGASLVAALPAIAAIATSFGVLGLLAAWSPNKNKPQISKGAIKSSVTSGAAQQETGVGAGAYGGLGYGDGGAAGNGYGQGVGAPRRFMARGTTIINLNGIVDAESARQSIEKVLQSSSVRTVPVQVQGSLL